jgi:AraC-like DNA-binding protein
MRFTGRPVDLDYEGGRSLLLVSVAASARHHQMPLRRPERPMAPVGLSLNQIPFSSGLNAWQGNRALAHIEEQLDSPLPAIELAALIELSSSHFCRAFKVRFGLPPHAYVLQRRIERAKSLMLAREDHPLAEIALTCGLSDQSHLSLVFRRFVGEAPKAWRTRQPSLRPRTPSGSGSR